MRASSRRIAAVALLAASLCGNAFAQAQNTREQEQLRRLRQQVQQLQQDQSAQQDAAQRANAEKAAARKELEAAQAELKRLRSGSSKQALATEAAQKELETASQERTALQAQLAQLQTELQEGMRLQAQLQAGSGELQGRLAARDAAFSGLTQRHAEQALGLQTCIANNQALRDIGQDLLQRFGNKGVLDVFTQNEPFLQFKRVALENLVQGYQDKLDQQALKPLAAEAGRAP
jgi:chromosome segregation ATPase